MAKQSAGRIEHEKLKASHLAALLATASGAGATSSAHNEEEANRQKWRRTELVETPKAELIALTKEHPKGACQLLASKRYGPYLAQDANRRPYLDQAKVKRAEHLDGKFVPATNDDSLSVADISGWRAMMRICSCLAAPTI